MNSISKRLRSEFDLAIVSIFGSTSAGVIVAFAIYRFASGDFVAGAVDTAIAAVIAGVVCYAWIGSPSRAGTIFLMVTVVACIANAFVLGRTAAYWAYLVLSVSFVVAGARAALIADLVLVAVIGSQPIFESLAERMIFLVTAVLVIGYCWLYNSRYTAQRQALEDLANRDPLTGAGNRRALFRFLNRLFSADGEASPAVLAVLDLDRFKEVNDQAGHEAGDQVLTGLADLIRGNLAAGGGIFRLGGDEFVVVLTNTTVEDARSVLDQIRADLQSHARALDLTTTVSVGATKRAGSESHADWLRRADRALYQAKAAGRNRLVFE